MDNHHSTWNGSATESTLFTNVRILDATGEHPYSGEVLVHGNRIKRVTRGGSSFATPSAAGASTVIDGMGATLMPGMIEGHLHVIYKKGKQGGEN